MSTLRKSIEKEKISPYFSGWSELEEEIRAIFSNNEGRAELPMNKGIVLFKELLEQCRTSEECILPLNNAERLAFIEACPSKYAAFRQLSELFSEMQKKIASKRAALQK